MSIAIAIDGPASAGKGTVARRVAAELDYAYVDTGALYRSVAWVASERGASWQDEVVLGRLAEALDVGFAWNGAELAVLVDGVDVTTAIRSELVGSGASQVSKLPAVRTALLGLQRRLAAAGGVVMDGRDIGTVVVPDAALKIFLTASLDERAMRRHREIASRDPSMTLARVRQLIAERDARDSQRDVAPLCAADDAVTIDTTGLGPSAVVAEVLALARTRGA